VPVDVEDYFDSAPIPVAGLDEEQPGPAASSGSTLSKPGNSAVDAPYKPGGAGNHGKS
jgi:HemY protein